MWIEPVHDGGCDDDGGDEGVRASIIHRSGIGPLASRHEGVRSRMVWESLQWILSLGAHTPSKSALTDSPL